LQMVFDETISYRRFSHLQGRTFYNGNLDNLLITRQFRAIYYDASFTKFSVT